MKETMSFQTEVKQLLQLVIHSLYSNKEIFLRELVSNSADAIDKLRFMSLNDSSLLDDAGGEFRIEVTFDPETETITVSDNGIGMNKEEVIENLGTIAQSGTKAFLEKLTGDEKQDANLIGQFGVGFYSSFIVADKVVVETRKAGTPKNEAVRWESDAEGEFTVEDIEKERIGTTITLHIKDDCAEFLSNWTLRRIVTTYSDHISIPIYMKKNPKYEEDGSIVESDELEMVNQAKAIWMRPKSEITDEEYQAFYKHVAKDYNDALAWSHAKIEGNQEYTHLLYIPSRVPFGFMENENKTGVKLYVKRVFIMEDDKYKLMPRYLRFVKGVIDSNDLPLNVSREILQENRALDTIRSGCVKKILALLEDIRDKEPEKYKTFWKNFGQTFKEGVSEDHMNQEKIAGLLQFSTSLGENEEDKIGLDTYLSRMKDGQDKIYYITAGNFNEAINSPQLELFKKKGVEVLLLTDRIDEWMINYLPEYKDKKLVSVTKGQLSAEDLASSEEEKESIKENLKKIEEENKDVVELIKADLGDLVQDVRVTTRLTESPACLVTGEHELSLNLKRMLEQAGTVENFPDVKPVLEINPDHFLIGMIKNEKDEEKRKNLSNLVFDQSQLAEGGKPHNPALFVKRLNELLMNLGAKA